MPAELGSESFCLADSFSFLGSNSTTAVDDIDRFMEEKISHSDREGLKANSNYIIKFWVDRFVCYPHLAKVALRILAAPASSASSERDFSLWQLLFSKLRTRLDPELAESMAISRSCMREGATPT